MISNRIVLPVILVVTGLMVAACQPITADNMASALAGQPVTIQTPLAAAPTAAAAAPAAAPADLGNGAIATVTATSLRVRAEPSTTAEVVAGIRQGEQYRVIGRSSDGLWLELAVPRATGGSGWVSANFVTVSGPITDVEVVSAPAAATPAPATASDEAAPTEAPAEEVTEAAATAVPAEEAAEAAPTAAPTEEAAEEPAAETAEAAPTAAPGEEAGDVVAPEAGFALVIAEGARLRVRAEPNTESEIVGWLQPGETIAVEETAADGLWVRVPAVPGTENLTGGWVLAEFLVIGQ